MDIKNIVFIGFMGCGKSSIARVVAKELDYLFIDTDDLIQNSEQSSIEDIFKNKSQDYFRECEQKVFDFLLPTNNACISLGGGFPIYIKKSLKSLGTIIYLQKSLENIISNLSQQEVNKRPLLKDTSKIEKLYNDRLNIYEKQANIIIDTNNLDISQISKKIILQLDKL